MKYAVLLLLFVSPAFAGDLREDRQEIKMIKSDIKADVNELTKAIQEEQNKRAINAMKRDISRDLNRLVAVERDYWRDKHAKKEGAEAKECRKDKDDKKKHRR